MDKLKLHAEARVEWSAFITETLDNSIERLLKDYKMSKENFLAFAASVLAQHKEFKDLYYNF